MAQRSSNENTPKKRRTKAEMEAAKAEAAKLNESRDEPFYSPGAEKDTEIMSKGEAPIDGPALFELMESFESTAANPTSTKDLAAELHRSEEEVFAALEALADADLIDSEGRGINADWFIIVPDVTAENAEEVARGMLSQAVKDAPKTPSASIFKPAPNALPKGTQVTLSDGTPATVLADEVVRIRVPKAFQPEFHESSLSKNGLLLDEPEFIPEIPNGVNANTWYMAHAADTQTARDWWMDRANTQAAEYMLAESLSESINA